MALRRCAARPQARQTGRRLGSPNSSRCWSMANSMSSRGMAIAGVSLPRPETRCSGLAPTPAPHTLQPMQPQPGSGGAAGRRRSASLLPATVDMAKAAATPARLPGVLPARPWARPAGQGCRGGGYGPGRQAAIVDSSGCSRGALRLAATAMPRLRGPASVLPAHTAPSRFSVQHAEAVFLGRRWEPKWEPTCIVITRRQATPSHYRPR
jgi:hypothetical protein